MRRDAVDRALLAALENNARLTTAELARRLGLARSTVTERMARLERDGVILGYAAIVSPQPDDPATQAIVSLGCDRRQVAAVVAGLRALPEVSSCHAVTGSHALTCFVDLPRPEDLDALIGEIAALRGVTSVETTLVLATKFDRGPGRMTGARGRLAVVA